MRSGRVWVNSLLVVLQLLCYSSKTGAENISEHFATSPGWTASGLPVNNNDFGFRQSSLAGGEPGEAGGFFSATDQLVWYGDNSIGKVSAEQVIAASGIMNIVSVDAEYNNNVFIGHFTAGDNILSQAIGFQILEEPSSSQQTQPSSFRIYYKVDALEIDMPGEGPLFVITNTGETREWHYQYDPSDGDHGSLTVTISGSGGNSATVYLDERQRRALTGLDTFGMAVEPQDQRPQQLEFYIDNVTYSNESTSPMHPEVTLGKSVDNPTPRGDELVNFTIQVSNAGEATADQVEVFEQLPPDMAIPEGMAAFTNPGYYDAQTGIWDIGKLAVGQDAVMTLPAQIVTEPQPPCVANIAHLNISGTSTDSVEVMLRRPDIERCVDLSIELVESATAVPNVCAPEQFLIYRFKIRSGRSMTARNVTLSVTETGYQAPGLEGKDPGCEGLFCAWTDLSGDLLVSFESDPFAADQAVTHRLEVVVESSDGELAADNNRVTASIDIQTRAPDCPDGGMDFSGSGGGGCFISTAAYGSSSHPDVQILREFRDQVLLANPLGKSLVSFYYRHSPEFACVVEKNPLLQVAVRSILKPAVVAIAHPWKSLLLSAAALMLLAWYFIGRRRRNTA